MTGRTEFANRSERIDQVLRRLIDDIREQRGLERITVVTPTNQASFYLRRTLAKGGLFNVDFKRLEDIAEHLAGREFNQPLLHDLQASEFVFESARDQTLGEKLGGEIVSPQLQSALHSTFRELELLDRTQIGQLGAQSVIQQELVDRFDKYMDMAKPYRRGSLVAKEAVEIIEDDQRQDRVKTLGTILLVDASTVAPVQRPLFDALANIPDSVTISIVESSSELGQQNDAEQGAQRVNPICVPDVAEEVRTVVREIIAQARTGTRFPRMAVVFEDDNYSSRVAEALELAGIPVSGPDRTALSDSPEGHFITGLLDIFKNDFNRLDVTAWISSSPVKNPSTNGQAVSAARWDAISRTAGVTESVNDSWVPRLDRYAKNVVAHAKRSARRDEGRANETAAAQSDADYAVELREFVTTLSLRAPTESEDSWSGFAKWIRSLVDDYLLLPGNESTRSQASRLTTLIDRLESLETTGSVPNFEHCAGVLREQLTKRSAGLRSLGSGVYVGPVWTAAGCPFETVFVLGMTEGRYPATGMSDPLLPDPMKKEIDPEGNSLRTVERSIEESQQSFVSVIESADQVFMYWPIGVPGESREFGPARWFLSVVRDISQQPLLPAGDLLNSNIAGLSVRRRSDSMSLSPSEAADVHEYDVVGARSWSISDESASDFPLVTDIPSIGESVNFEVAQESSDWTEFDGKLNLRGDEADSESSTVGSATAFETYAACPYRYFLSRRLHIEPTESPEPEVALDALTFGTLIHDVLEKFALWRMESEPGSLSPKEQEDWLREQTESNINLLKEETPGRSDGAWKIELSRAWLILRQWLRREPDTAGQPDMLQTMAEFSFGRSSPDSSSGPAVEVRTSTGKSVKFRGQVDRVDISNDGSRVIVYDYKSGGNSSYTKLEGDPVKKGTKLQLPLYSKAIAKEFPEANIFASYWFVREASSELKPDPADYDSARAETALNAAVETIVDGIEAGVYPARPGDSAGWGDSNESFENCMFCEYARVCPKSKARLWDSKKNSDPALSNYLNLAEGEE
jgi:hypothetical protein